MCTRKTVSASVDEKNFLLPWWKAWDAQLVVVVCVVYFGEIDIRQADELIVLNFSLYIHEMSKMKLTQVEWGWVGQKLVYLYILSYS